MSIGYSSTSTSLAALMWTWARDTNLGSQPGSHASVECSKVIGQKPSNRGSGGPTHVQQQGKAFSEHSAVRFQRHSANNCDDRSWLSCPDVSFGIHREQKQYHLSHLGRTTNSRFIDHRKLWNNTCGNLWREVTVRRVHYKKNLYSSLLNFQQKARVVSAG